MYKNFFIVLVSVIVMAITASAARATVIDPVGSNLLIGLDGDGVTTVGTAVTSWNDQASLGGSQNFTDETVVARRPTLGSVTMPNGTVHNVLSFDGSTDYLKLGADPTNLDGSNWSWFVVGDIAVGTAFQILLDNEYTSGAGLSKSDEIWGIGGKYGNVYRPYSRNSTGTSLPDTSIPPMPAMIGVSSVPYGTGLPTR